MTNAPIRRMTHDEYLAFERSSPDEHEFANGEVFAMAGGTYEHSLLALNVGAELRAALRGSECATLSSDMRVRTGDDVAAYPDASVVGGPPVFTDEARDELRNPTVLVEVLSPTTERYDRGDKFAHYQTIAALRDYVLVSTTQRRVEVFSRGTDGSWTLRSSVAGGSATIPSVGAKVEVDAIYAGAEIGA